MEIKQITLGFPDLEKVESLAKEAFPPEEYIAPKEILEMAERKEIDFLGLYDKETYVGFMVVSIYENMCYLFFLAIDNKIRSKGYGSKALEILNEIYNNKQQVVDLEKIDITSENNEQRILRKSFYLRNGYKETGKFISYLGVDYEILCKDERFEFETFKRLMKRFKIKGFNPKYF